MSKDAEWRNAWTAGRGDDIASAHRPRHVNGGDVLGAPSEGEIHLWLVFQQEATRETLLDDYRALLTEEERVRESRFYFEADRRQYLVTRALIRSVLSGYSGVEPRAWRFTTNATGRPQIAAPDMLGTLSFNLAHTEGLVACACATSAVVGVDTEYAQLANAPLDIADRCFSAAEIRDLHALPPADRAERFIHYWTLKESYRKATGKGLSTPLDQCIFNLARAGDIGLSFHSGLMDDPEHWRCWLMKPAQTHIVAVCAERATTMAQQIVVRKVVPLVVEEVLECEVIAQSPS